MEPKKLLQTDYLDIIYNNRNKVYGGYELRKNYSRRIKKGVGFLMLGLSAIVSLSFISEREHKPKLDNTTVVTVLTPVDTYKPDAKPEPPKPVTPPPPATNSAKITPPIIKPDEDVKPDESMADANKLKESNPGTTTNDSGIAGIAPTSDGPKGPAGPIAITTPPPIPTFVEQMPQPFGDIQAYLSKNINYPAYAREAGLQGKVGIEFVVNEDGSITNARVTRSLGGGCDEEALRVIKAMPKWKPGKNNGTPVKVMYTQVIAFKLEG